MLKGTASLSKWHTVVCKNGIVAATHPPKKFPYENTRPIDLARVRKEKQDYLTTLYKKNRFDADIPPFGADGPKDLDLREIFYTDKHEWLPRTREERLYATSAPIPKRK